MAEGLRDPRVLGWEVNGKALQEIIDAGNAAKGAALIRRKSDVVGGFPAHLRDELIRQVAMLSRDDFRQIEAATALALYGANNKEMRARLARERLKARERADAVEQGCWGVEGADDLGEDESGDSARGSTEADRILAVIENNGWEIWQDVRTREFMVTTRPGEHLPLRSEQVLHAIVQTRQDAGLKPRVAAKDLAGRVRDHLRASCARPGTPQLPSSLRSARGASGAILIDRGTDDGSAYAVMAGHGVAIVDAATVEKEGARFVRLSGARPFETADLTAALKDAVDGLGQIFSLRYPEDAWVLAGQIIASWLPDVSYSMFCIVGPAGGGKSSGAREIKNILDPESGEVDFGGGRSKTAKDLFLTASKRHVITLDNVTTLTPEMSDALCSIATGSSDSARALYTDNDEATRFARSVIVLTAIDDNVLRRPDLLDRGSFFELTIPKNIVDDVAFRALADSLRPKIDGGLMKGLAEILPDYDPRTNGADSRMAATVATMRAIDAVFKPSIGVEAAYRAMRARAASANVEEKPFILAVLCVLAAAPLTANGAERQWRGSTRELLDKAIDVRDWSALYRDAPGWPGDATRASKMVTAERTTLGRLGVVINQGKTNGARWLELTAPANALSGYAVAAKSVGPNAAPRPARTSRQARSRQRPRFPPLPDEAIPASEAIPPP